MKKVLSILMVTVIVMLTFCSCSSSDESSSNEVSLKYTYDSAYSNYDASVVRTYEALCEAVVNGEESFGMNVGMLGQVSQLFYTSFPLSALVTEINELDDGTGISIKYSSGTDEHLSKVKDFDQRVSDIVSNCQENATTQMAYIVNVYDYIAINCVESDTSSADNVYSTIMSNKGNSFTLASMFEYLLLQNDIKAYHIIAEDKSGAGRGFSGAEIASKMYYFDVCAEYSLNNGNKLKYFGITMDDIKESGISSMSYTNGEDAIDSYDLKFQPCRDCKEWELKDSKLYVTKNDGVTVEIDEDN